VSLVDRMRPRRPAALAPVIPGVSPLERRRAELASQVAELQFDLGGLAYEMAIRDHFRLDVLLRRAAELQQADAELGEIDRLLLAEQTAETGSCPTCSAPHSHGAAYCWQCGTTLMRDVTPHPPGSPSGGDA
jgi:hypothetical protein